MASNREGWVRLGNSYYFLLSISPGGQFSPTTLRSSRIRGAKASRQRKGFCGKAEKSGQTSAGLLQGWVFINKNKSFLEKKKVENLISLTKGFLSF